VRLGLATAPAGESSRSTIARRGGTPVKTGFSRRCSGRVGMTCVEPVRGTPGNAATWCSLPTQHASRCRRGARTLAGGGGSSTGRRISGCATPTSSKALVTSSRTIAETRPKAVYAYARVRHARAILRARIIAIPGRLSDERADGPAAATGPASNESVAGRVRREGLIARLPKSGGVSGAGRHKRVEAELMAGEVSDNFRA